ncbi:uncharacterized protein LOC113515828 [Galleria mellonella]|uniref:Uncharacterized protein LOC113515828 n=1 Tax=Galleria mellonella TaxID=7137 RepID=A0ABM3MGI6_GALME|nr:uncharacterized protein LOC113515828 [Galleria mellonella]
MSHTSDRSVRTPLENIKLDVPTINPSNIKDLITKRSSIKGRITKYSNFLTKFIDSYDKHDKTSLLMLTQRFERFKDLMSIFDDCQSQIEFVNSNSLESELDTREEIEIDFSTLIAKTQVILEKNQIVDDYKSIHSGSSSDCNKSCGHNKSFHFKLPTLKIGSFDGTYFKWIEFRDTYTSLIHNNDNIDPIHKFHYLNSYLEGEASRVISNLEVSAVNYKEAWHLLCERYNNEKQLIHNHLNSLCNIRPITRDSAKGIRTINRLNSFQRLELLRQQFWKRWQLEYVSELQQRQKWRIPDRQLQINDLVLLKEDNSPPMCWRMGRICSLFPGQDGVVRVVEIKTAAGNFRRAVKYICPLMEPSEETSLEADASKAPEDVGAQH